MKRKKVLLVDDDASLTRLLRTSLAKKGRYQVEIENLSRNAVRTAQHFGPDVIVLDVIMPGQDGGDVAAGVKRDRGLRDVPIIFLTSLVSKKEQQKRGMAIDGDRCLAKPVGIETLIDEIEDALERTQS